MVLGVVVVAAAERVEIAWLVEDHCLAQEVDAAAAVLEVEEDIRLVARLGLVVVVLVVPVLDLELLRDVVVSDQRHN